MINTNKVLIGLGQHISGRTPERCGSCPYFNGDSGYSVTCRDELLDDLYEMLEEREPRVLELDEIHRGMAVWLEDVDKSDVILAIGGSSAGGSKCFITENDISIAPLDVEYNVRWRAWTSEPTHEQRKEVEWDA